MKRAHFDLILSIPVRTCCNWIARAGILFCPLYYFENVKALLKNNPAV
jgi:hypothetical protein